MADFTPDDTFTSPVPALSDGQPANAAVLNAPHQALVNRTHWLKETIDSAGITREGATRIREVADEAALKALTGMEDGELAITQDKALLFRYSASAADAELARWVVAPAIGSGRWLNTAYKLIGGPGGLATTKNALVQLVQVEYPPGAPDVQEVSNESFTDTLLNIEIDELEVGDVVDFMTTFAANQDSPSPGGEAQIVRRDDDGDEVIAPAIIYPEGGVDSWNTITRRVLIEKSGSHTFMVQAKTNDAATAYRLYLNVSSMNATVYRP